MRFFMRFFTGKKVNSPLLPRLRRRLVAAPPVRRGPEIMPRKRHVWGRPDGSVVWVPVSDAPPNPPPPGPLRPAPLHPPPPDDAPIGETLGPDSADGRRIPSMADLLLQARDKLIEGDGVNGVTQGVNTAGLFSTGSGRSLPVSQRAVRRARELVGEEVDETTNNKYKKRKPSFGGDAGLEGQTTNLHVPFGGGAHKDNFFPMFQTGSGQAVLLSKDSIQKTRAVLGENVENAAGAKQPMFHSGTGRSVLVSKSSIDKARAVLGGQMIANERNVGGVDGMEHFPVSQAGSGRAVSISMASVQKANDVLEENSRKIGSVEGPGRPNESLIFQTGSGRPVLTSKRSVERSRALLMDEDAENIGQRDTGCQLPIFQTGLGRPVAVKQSSIKKASTVLENGDIKRSEKCFNDDGYGTSILKPGLGESILPTENSREKAQFVLEAKGAVKQVISDIGSGFGENSMFHSGKQHFFPENDSSRPRTSTPMEQSKFATKGYEDCGSPLPMFQTGSGNSVLVSKTSVQKARAILEEEGSVPAPASPSSASSDDDEATSRLQYRKWAFEDELKVLTTLAELRRENMNVLPKASVLLDKICADGGLLRRDVDATVLSGKVYQLKIKFLQTARKVSCGRRRRRDYRNKMIYKISKDVWPDLL